jgi:hypothetical protein
MDGHHPATHPGTRTPLQERVDAMMRRSYRQERGNAHEQMHCDELMQRLQIPHDDARAELAARFATQRNASSGLLYAVGVALLFWVAATQSDSQQKFELESALKVPPNCARCPLMRATTPTLRTYECQAVDLTWGGLRRTVSSGCRSSAETASCGPSLKSVAWKMLGSGWNRPWCPPCSQRPPSNRQMVGCRAHQ